MQMPGATVEKQFTIVHIDEVVDNLIVISVRCIEYQKLLHEDLVKDLLVE